jgi:hypothetical protein
MCLPKGIRLLSIVVLATGLIATSVSPATAVTTRTRRVSLSSDGDEGNGASWSNTISISADGRFVAFESGDSDGATNLVSNDTNDVNDVFVRDRKSRTTLRVSVRSNGDQVYGWSRDPAISADGRFVTFVSVARKLVPHDTNRRVDVFVHDLETGTTTRVSVNSEGNQGNGDSWKPAISADGRFVTFWSEATNLIPQDTNSVEDVFVWDRIAGTTSRVSVSSDEGEGNDGSSSPTNSISADGRFVTFQSSASNLVPNDTNRTSDVFVRDRMAGTTSRVSVSSDGEEAESPGSSSAAISADGRFVTFLSYDSNLVPNDTNRAPDIFVHDRTTGRTKRVSISSDGNQMDAGAWDPAISADGRFVTFMSLDPNVVPNDTNGTPDVFIRDRMTGTTTRVSVSSEGVEGDSSSSGPAISADGRFVAFRSLATNLVPNDTNDASGRFRPRPLALSGAKPEIARVQTF